MAKNHIVLFEPEIPQNTGNIMRTCVGTNTVLHLIKPLGFKLDDAHLKRSAVNYLEHLEYYVYEDYEDFLNKNPGGIKYYFSRYGFKTPHELKLDGFYPMFWGIMYKEHGLVSQPAITIAFKLQRGLYRRIAKHASCAIERPAILMQTSDKEIGMVETC